MANVFDYLDWRGDLTLGLVPLCDVDAVVLSRLSYLPLDGLVPPEGATVGALMRQLLAAQPPLLLPEDGRFIPALAASQRFCEMRIMDYVNQIDLESQTQFAAITVALGDGRHFVAFRGTDGTLVGWKEDFNMAFMPRVPAQADAAAYANQIGAAFPGRLLLCGHSKGGNLAIYAAAMCAPEIQARIDAVYAHDSPGFSRAVLESAGYRRIQPRIRKTIPQSSLIGMLLESHDQYTVVESRQSGIMQHDPFSWVIEDGAFRTLEKITAGAEFMNDTLDDWITGMSIAERERFVDALYDILSAGGITSIFDFGGNLPQRLSTMRSAAAGLDPKTREFLFQVVTRLAGYAVKNLAKFPKPSGLIQP